MAAHLEVCSVAGAKKENLSTDVEGSEETQEDTELRKSVEDVGLKG